MMCVMETWGFFFFFLGFFALGRCRLLYVAEGAELTEPQQVRSTAQREMYFGFKQGITEEA